jgi:hypothetical protein
LILGIRVQIFPWRQQYAPALLSVELGDAMAFLLIIVVNNVQLVTMPDNLKLVLLLEVTTQPISNNLRLVSNSHMTSDDLSQPQNSMFSLGFTLHTHAPISPFKLS